RSGGTPWPRPLRGLRATAALSGHPGRGHVSNAPAPPLSKGHDPCPHSRVSRGAHTRLAAQAHGKTELPSAYGSLSHARARHDGRSTSARPPPALGTTGPWLRHRGHAPPKTLSTLSVRLKLERERVAEEGSRSLATSASITERCPGRAVSLSEEDAQVAATW